MEVKFMATVHDAQYKCTQGGKDYLSLDLKPDRNSEFVWGSVWENITAIGGRVKKNSRVYVEGWLTLSRWESKGEQKAKMRVSINHIEVREEDAPAQSERGGVSTKTAGQQADNTQQAAAGGGRTDTRTYPVAAPEKRTAHGKTMEWELGGDDIPF